MKVQASVFPRVVFVALLIAAEGCSGDGAAAPGGSGGKAAAGGNGDGGRAGTSGPAGRGGGEAAGSGGSAGATGGGSGGAAGSSAAAGGGGAVASGGERGDAGVAGAAGQGPTDIGTAPTGTYELEKVPSSPGLGGGQLVWWRDRLLIVNGTRLVAFTPPETFETFVELPGVFGVAVGPDGVVYTASKTPGAAGSGRIARVQPDKTLTTVVDGARAGTPQHLIVHASGRLFWTNFDGAEVRSFRAGDTDVVSLAPPVGHSFGLGLSPDQRWLYASSKLPNEHKVLRYPLDADGTTTGPGEVVIDTSKLTLAGGDPLAPHLNRLQGLCVDALGNVYAGGAEMQNDRVAAIRPDGKSVLASVTGIHNATDCAFGGPDLHTLYVLGAAPSQLLRVRLPVAGLAQ